MSRGQILREMRALRDLLMLENVADIESEESRLFASIAPDDPVVHDICLLAEAVDRFCASIVMSPAGEAARIRPA